MPAYESSLSANSFAGFYQGGDGYNVSLKYATEGRNFDTRGGSLCPMTAGIEQPGEIEGEPIVTLAALTKRYDTTGGVIRGVNITYLIAVAGNAIYYREIDSDSWEEVTLSGNPLTNSSMDYVTYEVNKRGGVQTLAPVDVLLMTNADDGMICIYADDFTADHVVVQPEGETEEIKFGIISRHAERIWGSGIKADPDKLMYSAPFDPFDWEQNSEIPEDGAGDILQPSWDGDRFTALRNYGSYLLALKRDTVWRVLGTNPGEYQMRQQFGGGTIVENTVAVYGDIMMMLGYDGLMRYDGAAVTPFRQPYVEEIMKRLNKAAINGAVGAVCGTVYYLALPLDGSLVNNAILEYDFAEQSFSIREGVVVKSFMVWEGQLYYTNGTGKVYVLGHGEGTGKSLPMRWVSGWQDMGARNVTKSTFRVYLRAEEGMTLRVSIQTEKKTKSKTVMLRAGGKPKRVALNVSGRFFRIILETDSSQTRWWCLNGGLQAVYELDYD